jgi:hypothetical protein
VARVAGSAILNIAWPTGVYACRVGGKTGNSSVRYGICYIALAGVVRWE